MSHTDKMMLINNMVGYVAANKQFNSIINKSKNKDAILFSSNIANEEYTNDNEYGRIITSWMNACYKWSDNYVIPVGKNVMPHLLAKYKTDIDGFTKLGFIVKEKDDGNFSISLPADYRNRLPKFAGYLVEAEKETKGGPGSWLKGVISGTSPSNFGVGHFNDDFKALGAAYNRYASKAQHAEKEAGVSKGMITFNGFDYGSFAAMSMVDDPLAYGLDTDAKLQSAIKAADDRLDNMFANTAIDMGNIEIIGDDNIAKKNIEYNRDARTLIQKMYRNETWRKANVKRTAYVPTGGGAGQPKGYIITVTVPDKQGVGHFKEGKTYRFVVSGSIEEGTKFDPSYNVGILANNSITTARATGSDIDVIGVSKSLGNTAIRRNSKGEYETDFLNTPKKLNEAEATQLTKNMLRLQRLKYQIQAGVFDDDPNKRALANNSFEVLVKDIARITGKDIEVVANELNNYINE